ncbi:hypothetical protein THRCLA_01036 [Thraustotheca clavata]|uniref:Transmembrane protein n=1 Tax=Thraustotheca clavata TaxID=74557 RepID=A0A1W0A9D8_9STRA|nr:hypothetical protein THRCLA_01036 [Thraustotheca clavata]
MATFSQAVDTSQMPTVFALFTQRVVQYMTFTMIRIAYTTSIYVIFSHGHVEELNMFELSLVSGIAWVGRSLIFVQGLTVLSILSTASVELDAQDGISFFQNFGNKTCLAAKEMSWLVGIVNDIFIICTTEWTLKYATTNSILIWATSACLAILVLVEPTITIDRQCHIDTFDFQVICNLGDIAIGSSSRLPLFHRHLFDVQTTKSKCKFIIAFIGYLFEQALWTINGVYCLDTTSTVLNGVLSCRYRNKWYVFDIKTW